MARGPQGERGQQGAEGPEGPRGSIGLWSALALLLVGMGTAAGIVISGVVGSDDEAGDQANRLGQPLTYAGEFGSPGSPQPIHLNSAYARYDIQVHSRDSGTWGDNDTESIMAQHGPDCSGPPSTHENHSYAGAVFVCADHLMTAIKASGYGLIAVTPSQLLNCSVGCTVDWEQSTQRMASRDWPDVWLTPWADNLVLPFNAGNVDLQGMPRQGIHIEAAAGQNSWSVSTISNYTETGLPNAWWVGMDDGIVAGTNQAAVRQKFRLTITPGHVKMERLASATASQFTWVDANCACLLASDYVVQFAQHSYTPTKGDPDEPATWHWDNFTLTPSTPFTLIHTTPRMVQANNSVVTFVSPAPADAFLRFSAVCRVHTDAVTPNVMQLAPRQTFLGHPEHASNYWIPVAAGRTSVKVSFAADGTYSSPCHAKDFHIWAKAGGAPPLPTPTPPPATPTPGVPPTPTSGTVVTFDDLPGQNTGLNGQYPTGLINWGSNKWYLSAPWQPFSTKSTSFNNGTGTSRTFDFVAPRILVSLKAGGNGMSTITLACAGNPNKVQAITANVVTTITTGWTVPCTTVTVTSTNGWGTNLDDLLVQ